MALARQRDPDLVRAGLTAWADEPIGVVTQPSAGGTSSDTYLFRAGDRELVARLPPAGEGLLPEYNLAAQAFAMEALADNDIVPVPEVVEFVDDESFLGAPFIVMQRVDGRVPSDNPSYLSAGFVVDAPAAEQLVLQDNFTDVLARIHRADWDALGLTFLARPGGVGLDAETSWWKGYLDWAAEGADLPELRDGLAWCTENAPTAAIDASLLWGDVRISNVVFDDNFGPAAVLDWEMASIGPSEIDLGWYLARHRMSVGVTGADLPGFRPPDEFVARYEARLGRELVDLQWFEAWGAFRAAAIQLRLAHLLRDLGFAPDLRMQERNPALQLLTELTG